MDADAEHPPFQVLFVCTGNSARSIMAEALLNRLGQGRFKAFSAGSSPKGEVNAHALAVTHGLGFAPDAFRSKSWSEFAADKAPMDLVITLSDDAAGEESPTWPGQPITAHWGVPDPTLATGTEAELAVVFGDVARMLRNRIELMVALPVAKLDRLSLQSHVRNIDDEA